MDISAPLIRPSADFCFGRDPICLEIISRAFQRRLLLLFGGRQSGKTTILLRIRKILSSQQLNFEQLQHLEIPVYINLMDLPYDATPDDFWSLMSSLAITKFVEFAPSFGLSKKSYRKKEGGLDLFLRSMQEMLKFGLNAEIRFLFLVDEAKRILGHRFPRGVQDNIFSILYGEDHVIGDSVGMVFTGAQDLYKFGEDETSPLASRAALQFITCLDAANIEEILVALGGPLNPSYRDLIYSYSGGHAGLGVRLCQLVLLEKPLSDESTIALKDKFTKENIPLLRTWANSLSIEAKSLQNALAKREQMSLSDAVLVLKQSNLDPFRTDRAIEELIFTGLVEYKNKIIKPTNWIYWEYIANFINVSPTMDDSEMLIWQMIKQAELSLRSVVQEKYQMRWITNWQDKVVKSLSPDERRKLERTKQDVVKQYPLSPKTENLELLDFLYLGQLLNLMVSNGAWDMFMHMFRDQRTLEDMRKAISPVRNDIAHFRTVPSKELVRCRIACDDLLVILEKELNS